MKNLFVLFLLLIVSFYANAQTASRILEEANPKYVNVVDNSEFAQLWRQLTEARQMNDVQTFDRISYEIKTKFPDKFCRTIDKNLPLKFAYTDNRPPFIQTLPDWGAGDVLVSNLGISAPTTGNPTPFARMLKVESDTVGRLYLSYLCTTRDTIYIFKSTNNGLNWSVIQKVLTSNDSVKIHSFDFYVTDSVNVFRLGGAFSVVNAYGTGYDGSIIWATMKDDGTGGRMVQTYATLPNMGFIAPAIVSDGYSKSAATTSWYMTFQGVSPSTGAGTLALVQYSIDWGYTWLLDTARSTYNDYDLDIDYSAIDNNLMVLLTNNLTATNPNLRFRYIAISALGTATSFSQYNPASTSNPEYSSSFGVNRQTNAIIATFTQSTGGLEDIYYSYSLNGVAGTWVTSQPIVTGSNNENYATVDCDQQQGVFRLTYRSTGSNYDTVVYMETSSPGTGFGGRQVVNQTNNSSSNIAPDVVGRSGSGGAAFAGVNNIKVFYDGSDIITNLNPNKLIPETFSLEQNYPNPFNPVTNISFSLPVNSFVKLNIYDITGKEVKQLINRFMNAGKYNLQFDGKDLNSGIYFYKLTAGDFISVKKMILVK